MYREDIDLKLIELKRTLRTKLDEYDDILGWLQDLQQDVSDVEIKADNMNWSNECLKADIKKLEEELINSKNGRMMDEFTDAFIKCSYFCPEVDDDFFLDHVLIREKQLLATDGSIGAIIDCDSIPNNLKNTLIKWDTRNNFEKYAEGINIFPKGVEKRFLKTEDCIQIFKSKNIINLPTELFLDKLCYKNFTDEKTGKEVIVLRYLDCKVAFQKKYINTLLTVFQDMDITVYYPKDRINALIVEGEKQRAIFLPLRLEKDEDYEKGE